MISESFDEDWDTGFELFYVDEWDTCVFYLGAKGILQKEEKFLDESFML